MIKILSWNIVSLRAILKKNNIIENKKLVKNTFENFIKKYDFETLWKKTELYNAHRDLVQRGTEEFIYTIESSSSNYKERRKLREFWFNHVF